MAGVGTWWACAHAAPYEPPCEDGASSGCTYDAGRPYAPSGSLSMATINRRLKFSGDKELLASRGDDGSLYEQLKANKEAADT